MKNNLLILGLCLLVVPSLRAQEFNNLDVSPLDLASYPSSYRNSDKSLRIIYSRPQLKGRELSRLTPKGEIWRTGANEATEITFYESYNLGDTNVSEGSYTLYTIPGDDSWTVILNKALNVWGAYAYDKDLDVVRLEVPLKTLDNPVEALSMAFEKSNEGVDLHIAWGSAHITVPFTK